MIIALQLSLWARQIFPDPLLPNHIPESITVLRINCLLTPKFGSFFSVRSLWLWAVSTKTSTGYQLSFPSDPWRSPFSCKSVSFLKLTASVACKSPSIFFVVFCFSNSAPRCCSHTARLAFLQAYQPRFTSLPLKTSITPAHFCCVDLLFITKLTYHNR